MRYQENIVSHQIDTIARHIVVISDVLISKLKVSNGIIDLRMKEILVDALSECKTACTLESFYVYFDDGFFIDLNFRDYGNIQIKITYEAEAHAYSAAIFGETLYVSSPLDKYIDGIVFNRVNRILYLDSFYCNPYQIHDLSVDNLIEWKDSNMEPIARKRFLDFIKKISKEERRSIIVKNINVDEVIEGIFKNKQDKVLREIHEDVDSAMDHLGQPFNYLVVPSDDWKPLFEIYSQKIHLITSDEMPHPMLIDDWIKSIISQEVFDFGCGASSRDDYRINIKRIFAFFVKNYGLKKGVIWTYWQKIEEENANLPMIRAYGRKESQISDHILPYT